MRNKKILALISLTAFLGLVSCRSTNQVAASAPETVRGLAVVKVQPEPTPDIFEAVGTVRASRTAPLAAQVMGNVIAVNVAEGNTVKTGQVLLVIDDTQPRAAVEQAQAAVASAEQGLAAAESDLSLAQSTFQRMQMLFDKKSLSPQEFDEAKARVQAATARRDSARAGHAQAAAALEQARAVLSHTRVRAPFDGIVTERPVDPGALATPGLPLLTVEASGHYRLEASIDEQDMKYVRRGQRVAVTVDALRGTSMEGTVIQVIPAADAASRSLIVKIELPVNAAVRSGLFGRAAFVRGQKQAIFIPHTAVLERGQLQSVYVLGENNVATARYVTLGKAQQDRDEVLSGLSSGEVVVAALGARELAGKRIEAKK